MIDSPDLPASRELTASARAIVRHALALAVSDLPRRACHVLDGVAGSAFGEGDKATAAALSARIRHLYRIGPDW